MRRSISASEVRRVDDDFRMKRNRWSMPERAINQYDPTRDRAGKTAVLKQILDRPQSYIVTHAGIRNAIKWELCWNPEERVYVATISHVKHERRRALPNLISVRSAS